MSLVIVGGSLAGLRTAEALRSRGFDEPITLLGEEAELPYDRPPLSKDFLAAGPEPTVPWLRPHDQLPELNVDLRMGTRAVSVDTDLKRIALEDGDALPYDTLVIATGAEARRTSFGSQLTGFHALRSIEDARALRRGLDDGPNVLIVGGGFIGAEVAVAARKRDLDVTVVELLPAPMSAALGDRVGNLLASTHRDHGVRVICGQTVEAVHGSGRVSAVELTNGERIDADLVVLGMGVVPNTGWLQGSGLPVENGILCEPSMRVVGTNDVFAVGDVARWVHPLLGESVRVEHWTNANEHADLVASALLGTERVADAVPYVWSDQYGQRIQIVGRPRATDVVTVLEDATDGRHVAVYERDGRVVGMLTVGAPKLMLRGRRAIAAGQPASELLDAL